MTLPSQSERLVWGTVPGEPPVLAHTFIRFGVTSIKGCTPPLILTTPPQPADDALPRCELCLAARADLDKPYVHASMPAPGELPYSVHRHPELIKAVAAEFEAAGGRWAALQPRPLNMRAVHREFEAVLREHHDNVPKLLAEATGYLDLAMQASYDWGSGLPEGTP